MPESEPVTIAIGTRDGVSGSRVAKQSPLLPRDRARELLLRHLRPPLDAEILRALVELVLRVAVEVDAAERLADAPALLRRRLPRARVARPLLVLRLPVVADLLVRVLDRRERRPVCPLALAVLLGRCVVNLRERALRLRGR